MQKEYNLFCDAKRNLQSIFNYPSLGRERKLFQKKFRCEICGESRYLHVHHLNYKNLYDCGLSDLMVVCQEHHEKLHNRPIPTKFKIKKQTKEEKKRELDLINRQKFDYRTYQKRPKNWKTANSKAYEPSIQNFIKHPG